MGVGKGIAGAALRPTAGILKFADNMHAVTMPQPRSLPCRGLSPLVCALTLSVASGPQLACDQVPLVDRAGAWVVLTHGLTGEGEGGMVASGGTRAGRVRPPRMLHDNLQRIAPFSMAEALARHVLTTAVVGSHAPKPTPHTCPGLQTGPSCHGPWTMDHALQVGPSCQRA